MIKKLLFFVSLFFLISSHVSADTVSSYYFQDTSSTKSTYWNVNETWSYLEQNINFTNTSERYVTLSTCLTGTLNFEITENIGGSISYLDFYTGKSCSVQGYNGAMYYYIFYVNSFFQSNSNNPLVYFSFNVTNSEKFKVYQDIFSIYTTPANPLDNIAINDTLEDLNNNVNQQFEDLNNNVNQQFDDINNNINNNFQNCFPANKNLVDFKTFVPGYPTATGDLSNKVGSVGCRRTPNLIKVKPNTTYTFSIKSTTTDFEKRICVAFYKSNSTSSFIKRLCNEDNTYTFTTTSDTNYIVIAGYNITGATQVQLELGDISTSYVEYQEECNSKIDETNSELNDLNNNITNDNVSGVEESFSQFEDFLDENSTITQLITLPVTLYSSILNGISNSCTPFNLGSLYGESLILPCINIGNYLGSTLWGMIDLIISGFAVYSISKKLIKVFNNFSSMKDGDVIDD